MVLIVFLDVVFWLIGGGDRGAVGGEMKAESGEKNLGFEDEI